MRCVYWGTSTDGDGRKLLEWHWFTLDGEYGLSYYRDAESFYSSMLHKEVDETVPAVIVW